MHYHNLFIQCLFQITHHQLPKQMQPLISPQFETALLSTMVPYSLQQFQPGSKQFKIVFFNIGLN